MLLDVCFPQSIDRAVKPTSVSRHWSGFYVAEQAEAITAEEYAVKPTYIQENNSLVHWTRATRQITNSIIANYFGTILKGFPRIKAMSRLS